MAEQDITPFFYGRSDHKLNPKGQVAIPSRFRSILGDADLREGFVLIPGEGKCLYCYTHRQFRVVVKKMQDDQEAQGDAEFLRAFYEQAFPVDADSQGRIVIPGELRELASITGPDVVFIGHDDRIEIWDAKERTETRQASADDFAAKRAKLARRIFGA